MTESERIVWENLFSLALPAGWSYEQEGGVITIYNELRGVGAIHVSHAKRNKKSEVTVAEAIELANSFARERGWKLPEEEIASYQIDNSPAGEFVFVEKGEGSTLWHVWHIIDEKRAVFITYNCPLEDSEKELPEREGIIKSFKWEPSG